MFVAWLLYVFPRGSLVVAAATGTGLPETKIVEIRKPTEAVSRPSMEPDPSCSLDRSSESRRRTRRRSRGAS